MVLPHPYLKRIYNFMKRQNTKVFIIILIFVWISESLALTDKPFHHLNDAAFDNRTASEFTFAVLGDFRTSRRDRPYAPVFDQMLYEINTIAPSFVMSTGDAYYGYGGSMQRFKNEVEYFLSKITPLNIPFFNTIGNHEITGNKEREGYVKERFKTLYGSFDLGSSHFVVLNTEELNKEGAITGEQLLWLEKDLEANRNTENIFVFMHRPMFPVADPELQKGISFKDRGNRDSLHALLKKYKVKIVFAGHEHLYSDTTKDNIRYITTGGGGSPLYQPPQTGGFFHYLIVRVKGENVTIDVLAPYALQIRSIMGNDGFEPRAEVEISNISNADLYIKNLKLLLPMTSSDKYMIKASSISHSGQANEHHAKIGQRKPNGDGTAYLSIETRLPKNGTIRVVVETDI